MALYFIKSSTAEIPTMKPLDAAKPEEQES
jgi:hypothetical protein